MIVEILIAVFAFFALWKNIEDDLFGDLEEEKMHKMTLKKRVLSMARSDDWTVIWKSNGKDQQKNFCVNCCPHPDDPCEGDCNEYKEFERANKKKKPRLK